MGARAACAVVVCTPARESAHALLELKLLLLKLMVERMGLRAT